jgi:hypothetical protein
MDLQTRRYLARIGSAGGRMSRRTLAPEQAKGMVRIREARRAFQRFYGRCFWSYNPKLKITQDDVAWVAEQLMKYGDREAWIVAQRLRCH